MTSSLLNPMKSVQHIRDIEERPKQDSFLHKITDLQIQYEMDRRDFSEDEPRPRAFSGEELMTARVQAGTKCSYGTKKACDTAKHYWAGKCKFEHDTE